MEDKESKFSAPFPMEGNEREAEKERLIARKKKRKGSPRKFVFPDNKILSIFESSSQRPNEYFPNQEPLDQNIIRGNLVADSLIVNAGEDVILKILLHCGSRCYNSHESCNTYIISAVGSVSRASILQDANTLTYEGSYTIVSLSGHVRVCSTGGDSYQLTVSLADGDHFVFGGSVAHSLIAAAKVQIVLLLKFTDPPSDCTSEDYPKT